MLLFNAIPPRPEQLIPFDGDQSVLGVKQAIEARLRHAGLLDDGVDADGADTFAVGQLACHRECRWTSSRENQDCDINELNENR